MLKLIGLLTIGYAGHRGYEAQKAGVPIGLAFKAPFTPITELKTAEPVTEAAQEQAEGPSWLRELQALL